MKKKAILIAAVVWNLVFIDLVTKKMAAVYLNGTAARSVIDGFFDLVYVKNRGCAWGMLQGYALPLALVAIAALGLLLWKRKSVFVAPPAAPRFVARLQAASEPLLYAGIIGNLIDRLAYGHVIDFISLHWRKAYYFPCFNVADICISTAAVLLLLTSFLTPTPPKG